jgi:hypothetical protein
VKKIYVILIIVFVFRPFIPVVEYIVNYEYVSTVLCENIDKPELKCNGKCHLAKELTKSLEHKGPMQLDKISLLSDFIPTFFYKPNLFVSTSLVTKKISNNNYVEHYSYLYSQALLQPPIV